MSVVEEMPGFAELSEKDQQELLKFERMLRLVHEGDATPMEARFEVYGNAHATVEDTGLVGGEPDEERLRDLAREHVDDAATGRLPPEDAASNLAEDLRRAVRGELGVAGGHLCGPVNHGVDADPLAKEWSGKSSKKR